MDKVVAFFTSCDPVWAATLATTFTWLVTAAGASLVFLFKTISGLPSIFNLSHYIGNG